MFIVGEDQKRPDKGRTKTETAFKRVNNCVLLVQLGTFLTVATLCTISASNTFEGAFWSLGNKLVLDTTIDAKTINCTMNVTSASGGWNAYEQKVSRDNFPWRLAYFAGSVRVALLICGVTLLVGALNKVLMEMNIMEVKVKALVVRKEILTTMEILLLVVSIFYISNVEDDAKVLRDYFEFCGITSQTSLPFQPPFIALYIGLIWTLVIHACSWVALFYHVCSKPPALDTTRDHFQTRLTVQVKRYAQEVEHTNPYPENSVFQSAVDFADMPVPQHPDELGPVMGAYSHATVNSRPVSPAVAGGADPNAPHY